MIDELPLHDEAVGVLEPFDELTLDTLAAALAGRVSWVLPAFLDRLRENGIESGVPVARESLLAAALREAEIRGDNVVRCEYLLLGALRATGSDRALGRAREIFQELMADRAYGRYLRLRPLPRLEGVPLPCAVLVAGLPGTGKSTLAEALARSVRAPAFSMDWQLGALVPFGVLRPDNAWPMSELMVISSMARQLQLGWDAIVDAGGFRAQERQRLRAVTEALEAVFIGVECVCSDEEAHRSRLQGRSRGIPGWPATVSWENVKRLRERWEPWEEPHLVIDSAVETPASALASVLAMIEGSHR